MLDGYTYSRRTNEIWYCSQRVTKKCRANVLLNKDHEIKTATTLHSHVRPNYLKHSTDTAPIFIPTKKGNHLVMINNYTFSGSGEGMWYCSSRLTKACKARIHLDKNNTVTEKFMTHTHDPPNYMLTAMGYIKF